MKKILLPIMALLFTATVANAQETSTENDYQYFYHDGSLTLTGEDASNALMVEMLGDDWSIEATYVKFTKEELEIAAGCKVVGISVAGAFGVTDVPCYIKTAPDSKTVATTLAETTVKNAVPSVLALKKLNWNEAFFDEPYTVPATKEDIEDIYAGYSLLDADGNMKTKQILVGNTTPDETAGGYIQQNGKISELGYNYITVQLILEKPGTDGIESAKVADAKEASRYSLDGKRIYLPAKGINIVKMTDGTTRKVVVKK